MVRPEDVDIAPLFASERQELLALLRSLRHDDWRRPTPCEAWDVHGLCLHLVGDDLGTLSRHRDGHHGTPIPEGLDAPERAVWFDGMQEEWVHAARRLSPELTVELLALTGPELEAQFAAEEPGAVTAHVSWAGDEPVPVGLDHLRELSEYWVHRQQLLDALHRHDREEPLLPVVLEGLRWAYPHGLRHLVAGEGDSVEVEVTGDVAALWRLVFDGASWQFTDRAPARVAAAMRLTAEQAWRLLTNNLTESAAAAIHIVGQAEITDALLTTRAVIGRATWSTWPQ